MARFVLGQVAGDSRQLGFEIDDHSTTEPGLRLSQPAPYITYVSLKTEHLLSEALFFYQAELCGTSDSGMKYCKDGRKDERR